MSLTKSKKILGIDTTTATIVIAVAGKIKTIEATRAHSDKLLPAIDRLLASAKINPQSLEGVVVATGPGSFTGLRVGVVVANGIGYGLNKPVVGVDEFTRIRWAKPSVDVILLDAGRGEVFVWSKLKSKPALVPKSKVPTWIKLGDSVYVDTPQLLASVHAEVRRAGTIYIGPIDLEIRMEQMLAHAKLGRCFEQVEPQYLRGANITKPKA